MTELFLIAIGSNQDAEVNLPRALQGLAQLGQILAVSMVYQTEPVGPEGQPPYLNAAIALESELDVSAMRSSLRRLEAEQGRVRTGDRYAPRPLDLDISAAGQLQHRFDDFVIPDPEVLERGYLAQVLAEVAPEFTFPGTGRSLRNLASEISHQDQLQAREDVHREMKRKLARPPG